MERRRIGGVDWRHRLLPGHGPLAQVHPAVAFLVVLGVFVAGVWWGGTLGALLLGLLAVGVGALLAVTWPRLTASDRAVRILALLVLIAIAVHRWS